MKIFTVGFAKKSAGQFFTSLHHFSVQRLIDVRLNNSSQLAGFTKRDDLRYFAQAICHINYLHALELAPTSEILTEFKKRKSDWDLYQRQFLELMEQRRIEDTTSRTLLDGGCLLCSEPTPEHCHRRLVAEYLKQRWSDVEIEHIL